MKREEQVSRILDPNQIWDFIVIGGGATGLGCAVDAASRGYKVVMLEQDDFAKCTSSKSTKLVHGGVRYLQKGDVMLVLEALHERGRMKANAPHLVKNLSFVIANYSWWDNFLYFCGLTFYDMLSWGFGYGHSRFIGKKSVLRRLPAIKQDGLKGGIVYHDGQFDDARMAVNLAETCIEQGGVVINHMKVVDILHNMKGKICGVKAFDNETGGTYELQSKAVINAAGIFVDEVMKLDVSGHKPMVKPSQGTHLVLDMNFLQGNDALMVPKTSDGRVLFAVPWHNRVVVGTTDVLRDYPESEPCALEEEIDFILKTAGLYMVPAPTRKDILGVFAGQRPLAAPKKEGKSTKEISRSHKIIVSDNHLITITGGKWTSYRLMAEDTINKAISMKLVEKRKCITKHLKIHGWRQDPDFSNHYYIYGSDEPALHKVEQENEKYQEKISPKYDYTFGEVAWAVRHEMARTLDDVLARRVRLLFIDAREALRVAPEVAKVMALELDMPESWIDEQIAEFTSIAKNYIVEK